MLRKFLAETVTNGSIGLQPPQRLHSSGSAAEKAAAGCCLSGFFTLFCVFGALWISETLEDFIFFLIFGSIVGSCFWLMSIHVHSFYIQQNETSREMAELAIQDPRVRLQQHHQNTYAGQRQGRAPTHQQ